MGDGELERFKTEINLVELASYYGYECVKKESSRCSVVMKHADGDKIVVATAPDGHGVFFSVHEDGCGGSVLDLVMHREGVQLGRARQVLRRCLSSEYLHHQSSVHYRPERLAVDGAGLYAKWLGMQPYGDGSGYLEGRGLCAATLAVFADRLRVDEHGNVVFRHDDLRTFAGWEIKNKGFTGFSGGGKKALFGCKVSVQDEIAVVVVAESAIDVLSYYQLKPQPGLYLSFAGGISKQQQELLMRVLHRYPDAFTVIATDADEQGHKYAEWLCSVRADAFVDCPSYGKDWNDVLMHRERRGNG